MRETLGRNFDVIVVIWSIALVTGWMLLVLGRADLSHSTWGSAPAALGLLGLG